MTHPDVIAKTLFEEKKAAVLAALKGELKGADEWEKAILDEAIFRLEHPDKENPDLVEDEGDLQTIIADSVDAIMEDFSQSRWGLETLVEETLDADYSHVSM